MSDDGRYHYLPEPVRAQVAAGTLPPPRGASDPPDPIADLKIAMAVAEHAGDEAAMWRLNNRWTETIRRDPGVLERTWKPRDVPHRASEEPTRGDLLERARKAQEDGDEDGANALKFRAMHAPQGRPDDDLLAAAYEAEEEGDWQTAGRLKAKALSQIRGDRPPPPAPEVPEPPKGAAELNAAIAEAEAAGDFGTADRHRMALLAEARDAMEA